MQFVLAQLLFHYTHTFSFIYYSLFIHYFVTFKQTNMHNVQHPTLIIWCQESAVSPFWTHPIIVFYSFYYYNTCDFFGVCIFQCT